MYYRQNSIHAVYLLSNISASHSHLNEGYRTCLIHFYCRQHGDSWKGQIRWPTPLAHSYLTKTNIYTLPSTRNICQRTGIWTDARWYAIHNIGVLDLVSLQFLSWVHRLFASWGCILSSQLFDIAAGAAAAPRLAVLEHLRQQCSKTGAPSLNTLMSLPGKQMKDVQP